MENKKTNVIIFFIVVIVLVCLIFFVIFVVSKDEEVKNNVEEEKKEVILNEQNSKAKIGSMYYETLEKAIYSVSDGESETIIEILNDVNENIEIYENKKIVLELNNHKIINENKLKSTIIVKGSLEIKNGDISGEFSSPVPTIYVEENAYINLTNTNVNRVSEERYGKETIGIHGKLDIDSGKIISENSNCIYTYAERFTEINISGTAEITSVNHPAIYNRSQVKINILGGFIYSESSDSINNQYDGQIKISGGKIESKTGRPINNYGTIIVSENAEIISENQATIYNQSSAQLNILGGVISSQTAIAIINQNNANITISGGRVISQSGNAINNSGKLEISDDANIIANGDNSPTIYNNQNGEIKILGGTVLNSSTNYDVYNNGGKVEDKNNLINKKNWKK